MAPALASMLPSLLVVLGLALIVLVMLVACRSPTTTAAAAAWSPSSTPLSRRSPSRISFSPVAAGSARERRPPLHVVALVGSDRQSERELRVDAADFDDDYDMALVHCIAKAADDRKAENIVAMRVDGVSTLTSYLVVLSGRSRPQNQAIASSISKGVQELLRQMRRRSNDDADGDGDDGDDEAKEVERPVLPEGTAESGWMLLDYGSVMVHVMTPKSRLFYNIEGQWRDRGGYYVDLSDVLIPPEQQQQPPGGGVGGERQATEEEEVPDDPFWS